MDAIVRQHDLNAAPLHPWKRRSKVLNWDATGEEKGRGGSAEGDPDTRKRRRRSAAAQRGESGERVMQSGDVTRVLRVFVKEEGRSD